MPETVRPRATRKGKGRVLLLCDVDEASHQDAIINHFDALMKMERFAVIPFNPRGLKHAHGINFYDFDILIIHFTIWCIHEEYLPEVIRRKIRAFKGLKVQFLQDEYRQVDRTVSIMADLGVDILFTVIPPDQSADVYHHPAFDRIRLAYCLTGYVPQALVGFTSKPYENRGIDIGYRSRENDFWLGNLAREKVRIAEQGKAYAEAAGLKHDISCDIGDRLFGPAWLDFLGDCKAVLGTESGASIVDFDGSIEAETRAYLEDHADAGYEEVWSAVLRRHEANAVIHTIAPRVFEAAAMRSVMVMFEGEYGGVVKPWRHYLPLKKDFSNADELFEVLRDTERATRITENAYNDLIASGEYGYEAFTCDVEDVINDGWRDKKQGAPLRHAGFLWCRLKWRCLNAARAFNLKYERARVAGIRLFRLLQLLGVCLGSVRASRVLMQGLISGAGSMPGLIADIGRFVLLLKVPVATVEPDAGLFIQFRFDAAHKALSLVGTRVAPATEDCCPSQVLSEIRNDRVEEITWSADVPSGALPRLLEEREYRFTELSKLASRNHRAIVALLGEGA